MSGTVIPGGPRVQAELADSITVKQDGDTVMQTVNSLNFLGAAVAVDGNGQVSITTGAGGAIAIEQDGDPVSGAASTLNFTGDGVTVSDSGGGVIEVAVSGGGGGSVVTNGTLTGDGTGGDPLGINPGAVPIVTDGDTIAGNGTTGSPIHTNPGHIAIVTDGDTIVGNGTTGSPIHTNPGHVAVVADGTTITGNGTTGSPLIAHGGMTVELNETPVVNSTRVMNFTGNNISVTNVAGVAQIGVTTSLNVEENGSTVVAAAAVMNFTGGGVAVDNVAGVAHVSIPGSPALSIGAGAVAAGTMTSGNVGVAQITNAGADSFVQLIDLGVAPTTDQLLVVNVVPSSTGGYAFLAGGAQAGTKFPVLGASSVIGKDQSIWMVFDGTGWIPLLAGLSQQLQVTNGIRAGGTIAADGSVTANVLVSSGGLQLRSTIIDTDIGANAVIDMSSTGEGVTVRILIINQSAPGSINRIINSALALAGGQWIEVTNLSTFEIELNHMVGGVGQIYIPGSSGAALTLAQGQSAVLDYDAGNELGFGANVAVVVRTTVVVADGTSITGTGTIADPLVAVGGGGGGVNVLDSDSIVVAGATGIRFTGTPVTVTVDGGDPQIGVVNVTVPSTSNFIIIGTADVGSFEAGQCGHIDSATGKFSGSINNDVENTAQVAGITSQNQSGTVVHFCVGGPLTLTAPQWADVIAEGGPLVPGIYYLADSNASQVGSITAIKPVTTGSFVTVVGYAVTALTFVVRPEAAVVVPAI